MTYSDKIKVHLKNYKTENFPNLSDGIWKNNKQHYQHILPEINKYENILRPYRKKTITFVDKCNIKLHSDFHHLNSSQAMCLNFFFPLFYEKKLEIIIDLLGFTNEKVNYKEVYFEKTGLEVQYGRKPTSFDFYFETISEKKIYFEIKYTESDFGKSKINTDKYNCVYANFLKPINSQFHDKQKFYNNFQILRNLIHLNENSYVIFIYPKDNKNIKKNAERVKADFLMPNFHNHFYAMTWEECIDKVSNFIFDGNLKVQLDDFRKKYIPD